MPNVTLLPGLTPEQIAERRQKRFLSLTPEEKIKAFFELLELSLATRQGPIPPRAKLTLRKRTRDK